MIVSDCITLVIDGHVMISLIKQNGLEGALKSIRSYREQLLTKDSQKMFLILTNMQGIIAEQRKRRRVLSQEVSHLTGIDRAVHPRSSHRTLHSIALVRIANNHFTLRDCNISCFPCESNSSVAEWILKILQCIRDAPYQCFPLVSCSFPDPNSPNSA